MMTVPRPFRRAAASALLLWMTGPAALPADARLSADQEAHLKKLLPKTTAKLQQRELVRVLAVGDSISTFYQPPGFPRYDSSMAWQGRLLNRLGGYYYYHGTVDVDPHREVETGAKEATAAWERFRAETELWARTRKGPAPKAPDALRFRADLESPVAMRVPELVRRGAPNARQIVQGTSIQILNLARDGSQAPQVLEALGPDAFPPAPASGPDLVTICYGVNDAIGGVPLGGYQAFLEQAVRICRQNGAEVILAAPPVSFDPGAPRESLGRTRPYAQIVRAVAEAAGVAFVDLGAALVEAPSDLYALTVADAFPAATVPLRKAFSYRADVVDTLHPNAAATLTAGERAAAQLLDGFDQSPLEYSGGIELKSEEEAIAQIRIFNAGSTARTVVASPLSFTGWQVKPGTPDALFNLAPGKARWLNLPLIPRAGGPAPEAGVVRGSLMVSDDDRQQLADVALPMVPVAVSWPEGRLDGVSGEAPVTVTLTNQSFNSLKGTARLVWRGQPGTETTFSLDPKQKSQLALRLSLPEPETLRFHETAAVEVTLPDRTLRFTRQIEGVRHLGIGQRIPLVAQSAWISGAEPPEPDTFVTPFADARGIYFIVDVPAPSTTIAPGAGVPWGGIEVQLDGRKAGENGTLGFVDRLTAPLPWEDGLISLRKIRPSAFGHTYHYDYHPDGFRVSATTRPDGSRRFEFNIARVNLQQHAWSLDGSGQNTLGFNLRLTRFDPVTGQPSGAGTRTVTASGFGATDARSLTVLELSRTPAPAWSLRVF